jgi:very-short-patch-repair endonuclease
MSGILFTEWLAHHHGIAHSSQARAAGFSYRDVAAAVDRGVVRRIRRSWLVAASCDERRRAAAGVGGRVTCVSAAELHGIWVPEHAGTHLAVPHHQSRIDTTGPTLHWGAGPVPAAVTDIDDPPLNMLFHTARCLDRRDALAVWESAVRTGLVTREHLPRVRWHSKTADELARVVGALSDSGLETAFIDGIRPYGLPLRQQAFVAGHRVDVLIGDRLVIQLDGFRHHSSAADRRRDIRHDAELALRGYTVLRFDFYQVMFLWSEVLATVLGAVAQGVHLAR